VKPAARVILTAGLIAGALDILYVIIFYGVRSGVPATRILQSIAAGLLGRDAAMKGGLPMAALGLTLHFVIALGAAATFYAASRRLRMLVERPVIGGLLYGVAVWLFMNLIVLPLSATPPRAFPPPQWVPVFIAHLLCVGLPIAAIVRRASAK
jgi:uncharacterized membrane protein YagU involved in acid resistance